MLGMNFELVFDAADKTRQWWFSAFGMDFVITPSGNQFLDRA
jgi:hypothetical protein